MYNYKKMQLDCVVMYNYTNMQSIVWYYKYTSKQGTIDDGLRHVDDPFQ